MLNLLRLLRRDTMLAPVFLAPMGKGRGNLMGDRSGQHEEFRKRSLLQVVNVCTITRFSCMAQLDLALEVLEPFTKTH